MTHSLTRKGNVRPQLSELVINWHITEACNYRCRYCYAHWEGTGRELIHNLPAALLLLENIFRYFDPANAANPLRQHMDWHGVRLNLAGGEPLLHQELIPKIFTAAVEIGFATSLITNGSTLSPALAKQLAPHVSLLGVSMDSGSTETNRQIGRQDRRGNQVGVDQLGDIFLEARRINPRLQLKLNTVVNAINCHEDLSPIIQRLSPQRWKVLRMLPVVTNDLVVSDSDFLAFVVRHRHLGRILCVEDNTEMVESYLMIDPHGRFFQNSLSQSTYIYSRPIPDIGVERAFAAVGMIPAKFCARYLGSSAEATA